MIGAGSGISPYLPLLEEVILKDEGASHRLKFNSSKLIFVAREGEQISWVSNFLFHILNSKSIIPSLEFTIFITLDKHLKSIPSFLFWRAFLLIGLKTKINESSTKQSNKVFMRFENESKLNESNDQEQLPIKISFGRPNFQAIFKSTIKPN